LERYGVLTREGALGEGIEGGFAGVYPVLKALEERGQVRRGYFVAGLGAAQFALPGAVDRLRTHRQRTDVGGTDHDHTDRGDRDGGDPGGYGDHGDGRYRDSGYGDRGRDHPPHGSASLLVLAATDPGQPYGATLPWPPSAGRPARATGAHVVLADGEAVAYLERSGRSLVTFPATVDHPGWARALTHLVDRRGLRQVEIVRIDGEPPAASPQVVEELRSVGFADGYRGPILRR
jgi:ATP-dependent Lhr-like helicase